ncbi:hypothetical protein [Collimonas silvisoli]|uniref:hypothetical protein n=1 Tax=Collimonas silvisoli TaxID=2825884 RepID=UPI001B8BD31F|nr:hypothetical protein [Collimonas silvisoli]
MDSTAAMHALSATGLPASQPMLGDGRRIDIADGHSQSTADLACLILEVAFALGGRWVRCIDIVPGVTMLASIGELKPLDRGEKLEFIDDLWTLLRDQLNAWLSARTVSPSLVLTHPKGVCFECFWGDRTSPKTAFVTIHVHYDGAYVAAYNRSRRRRPILELPPGPACLARQRLVVRRRLLVATLDASRRALHPQYDGLPIPVRHRVSGTLSAWQALRDELDREASSPTLTQILTSATVVPIMNCVDALIRAMLPLGVRGVPLEQLVMDATASALWQAFELRKGIFYEPSAALHRLLDSAHIADNVPMGMVSLPADALCVIPEPSMRARPGSLEAVVLFRHEQGICFAAWFGQGDRSVQSLPEFQLLQLGVEDPDQTIREALDRAFANADLTQGQAEVPAANRQAREIWRDTLDYVLKMLLYLKVRDAHVVPHRAYSDATRDFSGLGKRKRAERLEAIEQLYDRFIVGPALLDEELAREMPCRDTHGEMSTHWRSPYFKLQHYGPRASLRKLMFFGPAIVRADRLGE